FFTTQYHTPKESSHEALPLILSRQLAHPLNNTNLPPLKLLPILLTEISLPTPHSPLHFTINNQPPTFYPLQFHPEQKSIHPSIILPS
ncbi:hypothetical protein, partial [Cytobacillus oceanisediminis]|uniref:hypothetical protein n=1 Tax=Cytobacillus oceanisediminis TaxID=665099 RepID=UPI001C92ED2E